MLRKQELKVLFLSDIGDFNQDSVLIQLDKISRRHYDMIIVIGDVSQAVLSALNSQFETSLVTLLPNSKYNYFEPTDGIENFNLRKYHFSSSGTILGYGSSLDNPQPVKKIAELEKYTADVLISYYPPKFINQKVEDLKKDEMGHDEVNRYAAFQKPKFIYHGGRKVNKRTVLTNGTEIISVYGMREVTIQFKK